MLVTGFENLDGKLVFSRRMEIDVAIWPLAEYPMLKTFFEASQVADRQATVTTPSRSPAGVASAAILPPTAGSQAV